MCKGINAGKDLNPDFLKNIYDTILKEPFTLNEDEDAKLKLKSAAASSLKEK